MVIKDSSKGLESTASTTASWSYLSMTAPFGFLHARAKMEPPRSAANTSRMTPLKRFVVGLTSRTSARLRRSKEQDKATQISDFDAWAAPRARGRLFGLSPAQSPMQKTLCAVVAACVHLTLPSLRTATPAACRFSAAATGRHATGRRAQSEIVAKPAQRELLQQHGTIQMRQQKLEAAAAGDHRVDKAPCCNWSRDAQRASGPYVTAVELAPCGQQAQRTVAASEPHLSEGAVACAREGQPTHNANHIRACPV
eukprot:2528058-Pleurochrysis_carterae.AAC.3